MQLSRLIIRLSTVFFSLTLMAGYVAWQAGAFEKPDEQQIQPTSTATPQPYISGSKFAPLTAPGKHLVTQDGAGGVGDPPEAVTPGSIDFRAYSSKSAAPLIDSESLTLPIELSTITPQTTKTEIDAGKQTQPGRAILPSSKRKVPLIEISPHFPPQQGNRTGKSANRYPDVTIPPTAFSGSKSLVPLIEVPKAQSSSPAPQPLKGKGE